MPKLRFALFGNIFQPQKSAAVERLFAALLAREADVAIDAAFYDFIVNALHIAVPSGFRRLEGDDFSADYVISLGGDGTFLEAARRVGNKEIPIVGVNMGRLGFLADVPPAEIEAVVESLFEGDCQIEERCVLKVDYIDSAGSSADGALPAAYGDGAGVPQGYPFALNEVAVLKQDVSSMISVRVSVNGEHLTTYQADGLIVNTPTGSTGYALSVGGSVMQPGSRTLGLVPVAPHSLTARPLTLTDDAVILLSVSARNHRFLVALDGRSEQCREGIELEIRRAPYCVKVLKRQGQSFFRTLREKLMWGADVRQER
ncbi:MAG: NAD kinase [Bacteroidaceae bacterium]|nr:NAD kinase [Bacteroidaceae bacterium]